MVLSKSSARTARERRRPKSGRRDSHGYFIGDRVNECRQGRNRSALERIVGIRAAGYDHFDPHGDFFAENFPFHGGHERYNGSNEPHWIQTKIGGLIVVAIMERYLCIATN